MVKWLTRRAAETEVHWTVQVLNPVYTQSTGQGTKLISSKGTYFYAESALQAINFYGLVAEQESANLKHCQM